MVKLVALECRNFRAKIEERPPQHILLCKEVALLFVVQCTLVCYSSAFLGKMVMLWSPVSL